jgi:hypothetical protein
LTTTASSPSLPNPGLARYNLLINEPLTRFVVHVLSDRRVDFHILPFDADGSGS